MANLEDYTLHHRIARPVSVHHHKPTATALQNLSLLGSVTFMIILSGLLYLAYNTLKGAPLQILLAVILPIKAAIIILAFLLYYKSTYRRELLDLEKRFKFRLEHGFKHL